MECHVLPIFTKTRTINTTFNLRMQPNWFNTFVLVVNYNNNKWEPCHITIGIFYVHEPLGATMVIQLKELLTQFGLCDKVIMYVKDEGANFNTLITTLMKIVSCIPFMLLMPYSSHVMGMQCPSVVNMLRTI